MAPPPVCQALFLSFQVSLPGSPGAGTTYLRQSSLPVAASSAAIKSRTPRSPPAAPTMILSLTASGAAVICTSGWSCEVGLPDDLAGVLVGGDDAGRIVGGGDDEIAPQRGAAVRQRQLLLPGVHAPDDAADVAGAHVDLVEHAPLIDDVEEAVLGQRRRLQILVAGGAADRDRIGELEVLDVVLVDLVERRVALRVIGAVVHQPVLRLLVGIDEPIRRHVGGEAPGRSRARRRRRAEACGCCGSWSSSSIIFCWLPARTIGPSALVRSERAIDRLEA